MLKTLIKTLNVINVKETVLNLIKNRNWMKSGLNLLFFIKKKFSFIVYLIRRINML